MGARPSFDSRISPPARGRRRCTARPIRPRSALGHPTVRRPPRGRRTRGCRSRANGPDLAAAIVWPSCAPRRDRPSIAVEVDSAASTLEPAVEPPKIEVGRAEMVVHDVDDDRDAVSMGVSDEPLEGVRPAVARFDGEQVRWVVAPRDVASELERWHHLHGRDAETLQVLQAAAGAVERAPKIGRRGEGADVHLVDDEVVPGRHPEFLVAPVEARRVVDDAVADRARDVSGIGIHPRQVALARPDSEPILVALTRARHVRGPRVARPVGVTLERRLVGRPVVECAGHEDGLGVRGPDAERRPATAWDSAHPRLLRRGAPHSSTIAAARGRRAAPSSVSPRGSQNAGRWGRIGVRRVAGRRHHPPHARIRRAPEPFLRPLRTADRHGLDRTPGRAVSLPVVRGVRVSLVLGRDTRRVSDLRGFVPGRTRRDDGSGGHDGQDHALVPPGSPDASRRRCPRRSRRVARAHLGRCVLGPTDRPGHEAPVDPPLRMNPMSQPTKVAMTQASPRLRSAAVDRWSRSPSSDLSPAERRRRGCRVLPAPRPARRVPRLSDRGRAS